MTHQLKNILAITGIVAVVAIAIFVSSKNEYRDDHVQAVVSLNKLATQSGIAVLNQGGTAADAAVAVAATLSVTEPWFSSVFGGGTWALYYDAASNKITSLDGVGPNGSKVTVADYTERAGEDGIHQSNVPGAWDGWMLWLKEYGKLDLGQILAPAIEVARDGYIVGGDMDRALKQQSSLIAKRPDAKRIYMPNGKLLTQGDRVYEYDLANTFEKIVSAYDTKRSMSRNAAIQAARDYYYRGPLAQAIVDFSDKNGGYFTLDDFKDYKAEIVDPISITYKDGIEVFENPPNSQGITMLLALNILKDYDFKKYDKNDPNVIHMEAEAIKLAFADRYYHVGDPDRVPVPVEELLSQEHTDAQKNRIDIDKAMKWPIPDSLMQDISVNPKYAHTTTFHIVDKYGNAAAVTTSLGSQFLPVGDTGIHMNNRMRFLALDDGNPNQVAPGYKVRHTSNPYIALKDGKLYILGGNTGADSQAQGQVQQFINVVEYGMTAQEAVARPRFISTAFPSTVYSYQVRNTLQIEKGYPDVTLQALKQKGHMLDQETGTFGRATMMVVSSDGKHAEVGADPRSDTAYGEVITSAEE